MNTLDYIAYAISLLSSFTITYLVTPTIIKHSRERGLVAPDLHKLGSVEVPYLGGIAILTGFLASATLGGVFNIETHIALAVMLSALIGALIGLLDDLLKLDKKTLVTVSALAGAPIAIYRTGMPVIYAFPTGPLDLGPIFWLLVPLGFAYMLNAVNIYAGFNGLEAGLAAITSTSLAISAIIYSQHDVAFILLGLTGSLLAFLKWNWYPAKIFPGNVGTYLIGAVLAAAIVAGTIKASGFIATIPYMANFILRATARFNWTVGTTIGDGKIVAGEEDKALWALFMRKPVTERTIVKKCLTIQLVFGILAVLYSLIKRIF